MSGDFNMESFKVLSQLSISKKQQKTETTVECRIYVINSGDSQIKVAVPLSEESRLDSQIQSNDISTVDDIIKNFGGTLVE